MDPSRLAGRYVRYIHYTAPEVRYAATTALHRGRAHRSSGTAECTAQTGSFRVAGTWFQTRTTDPTTQMMRSEPKHTCG